MHKVDSSKDIDINAKGIKCLLLVFEGDDVLGNWADARAIVTD